VKPEQVIAQFNSAISEIASILSQSAESRETDKWHDDALALISRVFGAESRELKKFESISYVPGMFFSDTPSHVFTEASESGLRRAKSMLESYRDQIAKFGLPAASGLHSSESPDVHLDDITAAKLLRGLAHLTWTSWGVVVLVAGALFTLGIQVSGSRAQRRLESVSDSLSAARAHSDSLETALDRARYESIATQQSLDATRDTLRRSQRVR
jgi:hypothetical protein